MAARKPTSSKTNTYAKTVTADNNQHRDTLRADALADAKAQAKAQGK